MPLISLLVFLIAIAICADVKWNRQKDHHALQNLNSKQVSFISQRVEKSFSEFEEILKSILRPRVPDTKGSFEVQTFIGNYLKELKWDVELDTFSAYTPLGSKTFTNIIATLDPKANRHLTFACHYDSKLNREYTFLGATDSAVPCAMMLNMAKSLNDVLKAKARDETFDITLQLIFFDGEEAFVSWSEVDSLYGSRHLAEKWEKQLYPEGNSDSTTELDRIDAFVLLDLLGTSDPSFYNYFVKSSRLYKALISIETFLQNKKIVSTQSIGSYFKSMAMTPGIEDDHIPFLNRGVNVLHLIPVPFPNVWHKESDNKENLDFTTIKNLNKVLWTFLVAYLHLPIENIS